jgi:hypothetical protein
MALPPTGAAAKPADLDLPCNGGPSDPGLRPQKPANSSLSRRSIAQKQ